MNSKTDMFSTQPENTRIPDFDTVTETNIGRQNFSPADIGQNKAKVLIERINRYYGCMWDDEECRYQHFNEGISTEPDIVITCVDSIKSRKEISSIIKQRKSAYYWMDIGNDMRKAQIILGAYSHGTVSKKSNFREILPDFFHEYPGIDDDPNDDTPSCSAMQSLNRQDLFINKIIASYATHMLWQLLRDFIIDYRGMYINLNSMQINKIPIK